jgi:hypothetical protein
MLGNQPRRTAKMYLRISPRKKIGIEIPISEATRLMWSKTLPYLLAARKPNGIPSTIAKNIAESASSTVAGKRCFSSYTTVRRLLMLVPRSAWKNVCLR